jgi:hypothetical protein
MARKSAAEQELQKAEAEYVKLHPLASQGNDVAPVTRGELRIILEDLLGQLGKAAPAPAPAAASPAPQVNTQGADDLKALGLDAIKAAAQMNGIDISHLPEDIELLAEYVAASMNLKNA